MNKFNDFTRQFHWKILLIRLLVNAAALTFTVLIIPDIYFVNQTFLAVVAVAIGLGILNAIVKPLILLLTGQLIFVTFGLLVILVNAVVLYLLERIFPNTFAVNSFFWAMIGGAVLGLVSNALENLLGLTAPIVSAEDKELRKRIEAAKFRPIAALYGQPQAVMEHDVETQSVSELAAAKAALEVIQRDSLTSGLATAAEANSLQVNENSSEPTESGVPLSAASENEVSEPEVNEPSVDETEVDEEANSNPGGAV